MKITTVERPYLLASADGVFTITSEEAQRLLDARPTIIRASAYKIVLSDPHTKSSGRIVLIPATLGGGSAFIIEGRKWW